MKHVTRNVGDLICIERDRARQGPYVTLAARGLYATVVSVTNALDSKVWRAVFR